MNNGLWVVTEATKTKDVFYKYHVVGYNKETQEPFSWSVPDLTDSGYDLVTHGIEIKENL